MGKLHQSKDWFSAVPGAIQYNKHGTMITNIQYNNKNTKYKTKTYMITTTTTDNLIQQQIITWYCNNNKN